MSGLIDDACRAVELFGEDELERFAAERKLTRGTCQCGFTGELFLKPAEPFKCLDCRANESRKQDGWTPANSKD